MKTTSLVIALGALAGITLLTALPAQAGGKAVAPLPPAEIPTDNLLDPIETTLSSGFDSSYMFRGVNAGQNAINTGINFSLPIGLPVGNYTANWGVWYINPTDAQQNSVLRGELDDEINYFASIGTTVGAFDIAIGWTHYSFLDSSGANTLGAATAAVAAGPLPIAPNRELGDQDEIGITIQTTVDTPVIPIDLGLHYAYNFDIGDPGYLNNTIRNLVPNFSSPQTFTPGVGTSLNEIDHYFEPSMGTSFDLTDRMSLNLGVLAGFYTTNFSHMQYTLALPIQIAENVVFEPYISYLQDTSSGNIKDIYKGGNLNVLASLPVANSQGGTHSDLFGGVSLSVSF